MNPLFLARRGSSRPSLVALASAATLLLTGLGCDRAENPIGDVGFADLGLDAGSVDVSLSDGGSHDAGSGGTATHNVLVRHVLDGDTIILTAGASEKAPDGDALDGARVRLIGVDAPEIAHDPDPADCYGNEAHAFTENLVGGQLVVLEYDVANGIRDIYGRLLAYVKIGDRVLNEALLEEGYAEAYRSFNHVNRSRYISLESAAKQANRGLWGACD